MDAAGEPKRKQFGIERKILFDNGLQTAELLFAVECKPHAL
jgi:hypothetical protein